MTNQYLTFSDNDKMPTLGLGTWKSKPGDVFGSVISAVKSGYRHIDCASIYGNEKEIGKALQQLFADSVVDRDELWITSKLWCDSFAPEDIEPAIQQTLADLQLEYLDLYLMHWPIPLKKGHGMRSADDFMDPVAQPFTLTWQAMSFLKEKGLAKHLGVSNFTEKKLKRLIEETNLKPEVNQVEIHPYLQQTSLVSFCHDNGIHLTAYSPLGSGDRPDPLKQSDEPILLENKVIIEIAESLSVTPAQVILAWINQLGISAIPKSINNERQVENLNATRVLLSRSQLQAMSELDLGRRYITGEFWVKDQGYYTLGDIWD